MKRVREGEKKQTQRAKQGFTAAKIITTWQPAAVTRKSAVRRQLVSLPATQFSEMQCRQRHAAGERTKFTGVCLAGNRRHLCRHSRHNNSADPKHIREKEGERARERESERDREKNNTQGYNKHNNIKHIWQALASALGRRRRQAG